MPVAASNQPTNLPPVLFWTENSEEGCTELRKLNVVQPGCLAWKASRKVARQPMPAAC